MNKQAQKGEMICHEPMSTDGTELGFGPKGTIPKFVFFPHVVHDPTLLHNAISQQKEKKHPWLEIVAYYSSNSFCPHERLIILLRIFKRKFE